MKLQGMKKDANDILGTEFRRRIEREVKAGREEALRGELQFAIRYVNDRAAKKRHDEIARKRQAVKALARGGLVVYTSTKIHEKLKPGMIGEITSPLKRTRCTVKFGTLGHWYCHINHIEAAPPGSVPYRITEQAEKFDI